MNSITLKDARVRQGLSLRQTVEKSKMWGGVGLKTLHEIENGKRKNIHPSTRRKIENTLGLGMGQLVIDTNINQ